jgi:agmatinase
MILSPLLLPYLVASAVHGAHAMDSLHTDDPWLSIYGKTTDLAFTGVNSFAHLPHERCLDDPAISYDIALLGIPFDSAVSYRPGARFGPHALRSGTSAV